MAQNLDLESSDFRDKNIQINTDGRNVNLQVQGNNNYNSNNFNQGGNNQNQNQANDYIQQQKENYANSVVQSATEHVTKSWYEKMICCLDFLRQYFNVTTADVKSRLLHSLIPFNPKFYDISEKTPDLYGPFWIYTTLVFIIAAAGSLAKYINGENTKNFFQEFVPFAAGIIYGIGFGLPIIMAVLMKCFGSSTGFISVICTYGYSFTIFIPVVIACSVPYELSQWILIAYGVFSSTSFILVNYWKELSKYMEKKRYLILGIILILQAGLLLVLKLYFFEKLNIQTGGLITPGSNSTTTNSTSTNSTLLF